MIEWTYAVDLKNTIKLVYWKEGAKERREKKRLKEIYCDKAEKHATPATFRSLIIFLMYSTICVENGFIRESSDK